MELLIFAVLIIFFGSFILAVFITPFLAMGWFMYEIANADTNEEKIELIQLLISLILAVGVYFLFDSFLISVVSFCLPAIILGVLEAVHINRNS